MAAKSPYTGEKLVEGVNADRRGGKLRARDPYEGMYDSANKALADYATQLQSDQPTMEKDIQAGYQGQKNTVQAAKEQGLATYGMQKQRATTAGESAVAEARRVGSELMQGIQSKFGSSTGTGGFSGELLGRQTATNISGQRAQTEAQMGDITNAENALTQDVNNKMFEIDTNANKAINDARNQLRDQLAQINLKKGEMEADKAAKRIQAIQSYAQFSQQLQAQKDAAKQQVKDQSAQALMELDIWKQKQDYTNQIKTANTTPKVNTPKVTDYTGINYPSNFVGPKLTDIGAGVSTGGWGF